MCRLCTLSHRFITQASPTVEGTSSSATARPPPPPSALTSAVSWRADGIKYRKNEVFLDVIESINLLVSSTGGILRSEVLGQVRVKSHLSGMPELRLGLNDKVLFESTAISSSTSSGRSVELEDVRFHQCVRLNKFDSDRTISFIPPDGEFELMTYRVSLGGGGGSVSNREVYNQQSQFTDPPVIWVTCTIERWSSSRVEYVLKVQIYFCQSKYLFYSPRQLAI